MELKERVGYMWDTHDVDTRSRLISSTAHLIHASSYGAVGVKAICEQANVKKGSFYHFFESKQSLVLAALDLMWTTYERDCIQACFDPSLTPRQRIEALFDYAYKSHTDTWRKTGHVLGCPFGNLAAEASTLDESIRDRVLQVFAEWAAMIEGAITEALDAGELDSSLSAETTSLSILSTLQGAILMAKVSNDTRCIPGIGQEAVATLWGGVAA